MDNTPTSGPVPPADAPGPETRELVAQVTAQLYSVTTKKDGGGRISFDFGLESLKGIHKIQEWNAQGGMNFALAIVPYQEK